MLSSRSLHPDLRPKVPAMQNKARIVPAETEKTHIRFPYSDRCAIEGCLCRVSLEDIQCPHVVYLHGIVNTSHATGR